MRNYLMDAFSSLGQSINKLGGKPSDQKSEGIVSDRFPELSLEMENDQLIKLTKRWKESWETSDVATSVKNQGEENERYWKGKQYGKMAPTDNRAIMDNLVFESLETFLPQATRRNPEPTVDAQEGTEESPETAEYVNSLKKKLWEIADELRLRLKLKGTARHWALYLLGAIKLGWSMDKDIPMAQAVRLSQLILDPSGTIDEDGYHGEFIGHIRKDLTAFQVLNILENVGGEAEGIKAIQELVDKDTGTKLGFVEWWTEAYMCWTMGKEVLLKKKNPHWNYDTEKEASADPMTGMPPTDETGAPQMEPVAGFNHFPTPQMPFLFLTVFNTGQQPVDDTSLIGQNLSNQDLINKRNKQIDKNADGMNGGLVVSIERSGLTKDQAKGVTDALHKGGTVLIPTGTPRDAVDRFNAQGLPADIFNQLVDMRNRMRDIFGTRGSSAAGIESETTVRGKVINKTLDTDRIGGGISEYLEQLSDGLYNWFTQLLYVYDNTYALMPNKPRVKISVKEGSLLPKDSTTIANQAIDLATAGKMSTLDLYKKLDYPNPEELAANVWLEINAPEVLYEKDPRVAQVMQMRQDANKEPEKSPSQSISFKDLPPEGQVQMAAKVGIVLDAEGIAANEAHRTEMKKKPNEEALPPIED